MTDIHEVKSRHRTSIDTAQNVTNLDPPAFLRSTACHHLVNLARALGKPLHEEEADPGQLTLGL